MNFRFCKFCKTFLVFYTNIIIGVTLNLALGRAFLLMASCGSSYVQAGIILNRFQLLKKRHIIRLISAWSNSTSHKWYIIGLPSALFGLSPQKFSLANLLIFFPKTVLLLPTFYAFFNVIGNILTPSPHPALHLPPESCE